MTATLDRSGTEAELRTKSTEELIVLKDQAKKVLSLKEHQKFAQLWISRNKGFKVTIKETKDFMSTTYFLCVKIITERGNDANAG